jgi:hypothetical protein
MFVNINKVAIHQIVQTNVGKSYILDMKAEITILKFKLPNVNKIKSHQPTYCKFAIQKGLENSYAAAPLIPKLERHMKPEF